MAWWEWVPIVKTISHALDDPPGRATTDYAACATTVANCEGLGKAVAELACEKCIDAAVLKYVLDWLGIANTGPELLEGVAAAVALKFGPAVAGKAATGVGAALIVDDLVDAGILIKKAFDIDAAGAAAKKSLCTC